MKTRLISATLGVWVAFFSTTHAAEPMPAKINNDFAIALYQTLSTESADNNLFISPYSIYSALGMAYAGSNSNTKVEFKKSLGIKDPATFHASLSKTIESLNARDGQGFSISTANALWVDRTAKVSSSYKDLMAKYYGTSETSIDVTQPKDSADKINDWVEEKTSDKIHNLITPDNITPYTKLILTNAVYFKGEWLKTFEHETTRESDFNAFSGAPIKVPMMHQKNYFKYKTVNNDTFIELPYKENHLSMIIILPEKKGSAALAATENNLASNLNKFLAANNDSSDVILTLPKFKVETPLLTLNGSLQKLGIKDAFTYPKADFSGINGNRDLYIGLVAHKAVINVDELGTEAAAATEVTWALGALPTNKPKEFVADRPFLYLIRDNETGLVLFIGKLLNPVAI